MSLRLRLVLAMLAMLVASALVMGLVAYRNVLGETEALFDYQLRQMALSLRDQGEIASAQAGPLADESLDFVIQIWTVDGRSIYASRPHAALPARALLGLANVDVRGQVWRTFSVATRDRVIQVAQPLQIRHRLAARAALRSVLPLLLVTPLLALGVWWLSGATLAPLARVAGEVRRRDEQSLAALGTDDLPNDIAPLVHALNGLLQRLRESLEGQRAFVADAAHELRSPLTALKLQLAVLRRTASADERAAALDALGVGIERAGRLVEQLLQLARNEPGAPGAPFERVDLAEVARDAIAATLAFAVSRGVEFELFADAPVHVDGDRAALGVLVRNLVDNAARYSPAGARVEVRVASADGAATLDVDDAGPGIPAADRERVFDRFYRRSADQTGSGLGLAIVQRIVERHGATVQLGDAPLGGLRVSVRFGRTLEPVSAASA
ncbi:ATP-binding protein [Piscinibacter koreensis]|uniref:histidine kinase n=1 Tax=Piscinibacter koreensis TaxID=2742824 RepID=A0A7Y6NPZ7_9BURK|nr:ATP-binding protein [Schlegelella koreensis]NUZ07151.1 sensor histidine kinase N-terminal domain-containing protein [Schlegelella koreensis]